MTYAKTDIHAQIKRLEEKHGKDVVLQALEEYLRRSGVERVSKFKKVYADLPDGMRKEVHAIDFSNRSVEVVDYMAYDGLAEWILDDVDIIFEQPTLNDNQQVLLKWLKKKCDDCAFIPFNPFPAIRSLYYLGLDLDEIEVRNIIDELNRKQQAQVLRVFSDWALEQEEE